MHTAWNPRWLSAPENSIRVLWQSPARAFWESSDALKSFIIGRISPPSLHSESAAGAATMSRRHHSKHCRAQHEQHAVLIFLPHTVRQSSSTRLGAVNCLHGAPPSLPPSLPCSESYQMSLCGNESFEKNKLLLNYGEFGIRRLRTSRG